MWDAKDGMGMIIDPLDHQEREPEPPIGGRRQPLAPSGYV